MGDRTHESVGYYHFNLYRRVRTSDSCQFDSRVHYPVDEEYKALKLAEWREAEKIKQAELDGEYGNVEDK